MKKQGSLILVLIFALICFVGIPQDAAWAEGTENFTLSVVEPELTVIQGQTAEFVVDVKFVSGFSTAGGINFFIPEASDGSYAFSPVPVKNPGGVLLQIDTSSLAAGTYEWQVQSLEDQSSAQFAPITLNVIHPTDILFDVWDGTQTQNDVTSVNVASQDKFEVCGRIMDDDGEEMEWDTPFTLQSGDPGKMAVYLNQYGSYDVYAIDNGTVTLTAACADGLSRDLTVNINIPADAPRITAIDLNPMTVTNGGDEDIYFTVTTMTPAPITVGVLGVMGVDFVDHEWSDDLKTYTSLIRVNEGEVPGEYLFYGSTSDEVTGLSATRAIPLTLVNDPARCEIKGTVQKMDAGDFVHHGASGMLELYDPVTETKVYEQHIWNMTNEYCLPYVTPGNYRLRFIPDSAFEQTSQWYPNAPDYQSADVISVNAGQTTEDIHFFIASENTEPVEGDVNDDGLVDQLDLSAVALAYGMDSTMAGFDSKYDINQDDIVDLYDIVLIAKKII